MNATAPKLLVVDDESVVRESCTRILEPEGFEVEVSASSREGLARALADRFAAILLDIMLPDQDGLTFLQELRRRGNQVPVIIITGYSNVPSAAAAMRLGASDYIPKPFSPDEILGAVRRIVPPVAEAAPTSAPGAVFAPLEGELLFGDEAWLQRGAGGTVRVGTLCSRRAAESIRALQLPAPGATVHRGLPLCALEREGVVEKIASPITGEVVAINPALAAHPELTAGAPAEGWIAELRPTALDADLRRCRARTPVLVSGDELAARRLAAELASLGCRATLAADEGAALAALRGGGTPVLLLDALGLGARGPALAAAVTAAHPEVRVIVLAGPSSGLEREYREAGVFYYAVEPFVDGEIVELLQVAYQQPLAHERPRRGVPGLPHWVRRVSVVNARGERVALLAPRELLQEGSGVGRELIRALQRRALPVQIALGYGELAPLEIAEAAARHDRVVLLVAEKEAGLAGSLRRGGRPELAAAASGKATVLTVAGDVERLDLRTSVALAEHLTAELL